MNAAVDCELLVLGGGLAGLAAASSLNRRAVVLERAAQPGGLVRTDRVGDYWLDWSVHLLYFDDPDTEREVRSLLGDVLAPCPPRASVVTRAGEVPYPLQLHLGDLHPEAAAAALLGMAQAAYAPPSPPRHFGDMLRMSFGEALCELFFFPYNRKLYKRSLETLAPVGFQWNIARPDFAQALRAALVGGASAAYNANGWYPRPNAGAEHRGIEVLSRALAHTVGDLRLEHEVVGIDLSRRRVEVDHRGERQFFRYESACCATLPLDRLVALCADAPADLKDECRRLRQDRVRTVGICLRGERPLRCVHWRYFPDEDLVFHRLVYPHAFDENLVPADGWSILAEITEPAESERAPTDALVARVLRDLRAAAQLPAGTVVVDVHGMELDPGYVAFGLEDQPIVDRARDFLERQGVSTVGRYARWEYSSMAQVMRDGFAWRSRWRERA